MRYSEYCIIDYTRTRPLSHQNIKLIYKSAHVRKVRHSATTTLLIENILLRALDKRINEKR